MKPETCQPQVVIGIPVLLAGGTEIQTLSLVSVLISGGFGVTVCCYYEYDQVMVSAMEKTGAGVVLLGLRRKDGLLSLLGKLRAFFRKIKPDIVHVQYIAPGLVPVLAARLAGIKTVFATVHQPGRTYSGRERFLLRTASRLSSVFFCVSRSAEESWFGDSELFNAGMPDTDRRHFTLYNAVDTGGIETVCRETDRRALQQSLGISGGPTIGVVGRLRHEKGQAVLFQAMKDVIREYPEAVLVVVGDGPDREQLKTPAESLGIGKHIFWSGALPHEQVARMYCIMDVLAVPSFFEGFGLAAAEAQAAGLPVVASAVDSLPEIIEGGATGYLVPADDCRSLAAALIRLLRDPEKARSMGARGQDRMRSLFSLERFSASILAAYARYPRIL